MASHPKASQYSSTKHIQVGEGKEEKWCNKKQNLSWYYAHTQTTVKQVSWELSFSLVAWTKL